MARATIAGPASFKYIAEISPISALPGQYSLTFVTTWDQARDAPSERRVVQLTTNATGLAALAALIQQAIDP